MPEIAENEVVEPKTEIAETDLLKGLQALEQKAKGEEPTPEPTPEPAVPAVEAAPLAKTVEEEGSEVLAKSLEVSSTLKEFGDLLGAHVDTLAKSFAGTLTNQNAAILAITGCLEGMQKSIDSLNETVGKYGEKPAAPASAKSVETPAAEVLAKGVGSGSGDPAEAPQVTESQVSDGLMSLVKTATDDEDKDRFTNALVKFESTKQISDKDLARALGEHKRITGLG